MTFAAPTVQAAFEVEPFGRDLPASVGPVLFARGATAEATHLSALVARRSRDQPPVLVAAGRTIAPVRLTAFFGWSVWGYDFALRTGADASYELEETRYPVVTDLGGDVRIAFVSCNGQEEGDDERPLDERNLMWRRLADEHAAKPFALLLQGGDQLYADEALHSHPDVARWAALPARKRPGVDFTDGMREAVRRWYAARYLTLMAEPAMSRLVAHVPSIMMWDDHDIMDGWGSHPAALQDSAVGRGVFAAAREMFTLFQLGAAPDAPPPLSPDATGQTFTLGAAFPGFRVLAPDLRSERTLSRVMGPDGWCAFDATLAAVREGERVLVVSSVPALGPRLSLVERVANRLPGTQGYEDDLRDQWQSYAHRLEWRRFLESLDRLATGRGAAVTALSGEIHLATRGTMRLGNGRELHQLVASGISHPEPSQLYAKGLGLLSRFGKAPLPGQPIRMLPLPGQRGVYTAERNYLVLERRGEAWSAEWELEKSGRTASLAI